MSHHVEFIDPGDYLAAQSLFLSAVHVGPLDEAGAARGAQRYEPGRTLGIRDAGGLVASAMSFGARAVVPGGAVVSTACVSRVGVRADRTRRGYLSAMMRRQLEDISARGEVLASLRATEARIYGRFGYGVASRGREVRVRRSGSGWRQSAPLGGSVRLVERDTIIDTLAPLHERIALRRVGGITRQKAWWESRIGRPLADRAHIIAAVHTGPDGDDGFALAVLGGSPNDEFTGRTLRVEDMHAPSIDATAGLWRFLLGIDLIAHVEGALRPIDEPLELLLADPRDCVVRGVMDETWLRIIDVPAALAARTYGSASPVLLAVHDPLLEGNAGVYRITSDTAERVGPLGGPVTPQLECDVTALAMAYLGDRRPSELVAAGWWSAPDPAAVAGADSLFATAGVPWCGTFF